MSKIATPDMLDPNTPDNVIIRTEPRPPETDPTLGIPVATTHQGIPQHRLVTIGNSLTHVFQNRRLLGAQKQHPTAPPNCHQP